MLRTVPVDAILSWKLLTFWNCDGTVGYPAAVIEESLFEPLKMCRTWSPRYSAGVVLLVRYEPPATFTKNVGLMTQSRLPAYVSFVALPLLVLLIQRLSNAAWLIVPSAFLSNVDSDMPLLGTPLG